VQSQGLDPGTHEGVLHNRSITVDEAIETIGVQFSAFFVCQAVRLLFSRRFAIDSAISDTVQYSFFGGSTA
jgi:hypothetical protein